MEPPRKLILFSSQYIFYKSRFSGTTSSFSSSFLNLYKQLIQTGRNKALLFIIVLRIVSGSIDITAAMLIFKFNDLEKAFYINTLLALVKV